MARIESESTRMGRLVEELLLLARLDQQRPLVPAPSTCGRIVADAAADHRAVDPGHPLVLPVEPDGEPVGPVAAGDEAALRQVVGNLLANVRGHTPPDATPTVELRREPVADPPAAVLDVADESPASRRAARPGVRAVPPRRPVAGPGHRRRRPRASPSWRRSSPPTVGPWRWPTPHPVPGSPSGSPSPEGRGEGERNPGISPRRRCRRRAPRHRSDRARGQGWPGPPPSPGSGSSPFTRASTRSSRPAAISAGRAPR